MNERKIRDDKTAENAVMSPSASEGVNMNISALVSLSYFYHTSFTRTFQNGLRSLHVFAPVFLKNTQRVHMRLSSPRFSSHRMRNLMYRFRTHMAMFEKYRNIRTWESCASSFKIYRFPLDECALRTTLDAYKAAFLPSTFSLPTHHTSLSLSKDVSPRFHGLSLLPALSRLEYLQVVHMFYPTFKNTWGAYCV